MQSALWFPSLQSLLWHFTAFYHARVARRSQKYTVLGAAQVPDRSGIYFPESYQTNRKKTKTNKPKGNGNKHKAKVISSGDSYLDSTSVCWCTHWPPTHTTAAPFPQEQAMDHLAAVKNTLAPWLYPVFPGKCLGKGMVVTPVSLTPLVKSPAHENIFPSPQH